MIATKAHLHERTYDDTGKTSSSRIPSSPLDVDVTLMTDLNVTTVVLVV